MEARVTEEALFPKSSHPFCPLKRMAKKKKDKMTSSEEDASVEEHEISTIPEGSCIIVVLERVESTLKEATNRASDGNIESMRHETSMTQIVVTKGVDTKGITLETNVTQSVVSYRRTLVINEEPVTRVAFEDQLM